MLFRKQNLCEAKFGASRVCGDIDSSFIISHPLMGDFAE